MASSNESDLCEFVSSLQGGDGLRVEETLGDGYVRLRIAEAERRQAKHDIRNVEDAVIELLRNARDAGARRVFVASSSAEGIRTLTIVDDGCGIPKSMHKRVFDARVTSKLDTLHMDRWGVHGRGMALFSIAQNAREARVVCSALGLGTCIQVVFDTKEVQERADQSTWPSVVQKDDGCEVRGPRNIVRACVEFALEERGRCNVYFGSPSEAIATMRARMSAHLPQTMVRELGIQNVPLIERPTCASDAKELRMVADSFGLYMSERTAHRIIKGQIKPLRHVLAQPMSEKTDRGSLTSKIDLEDRARALPLSSEDRAAFITKLSEAFEEISRRYYVVPLGEPRVSVGKGSIRVVFEYDDDE